MINKESRDKKTNSKPNDSFKVDVSAHLKIKDVGSGKELVNKRG